MAPGGGYGEAIMSTWGYYDKGNLIANYAGMIGTSMATPHVSGVAALLKASGVNDPEEIRSLLIDTLPGPGDRG